MTAGASHTQDDAHVRAMLGDRVDLLAVDTSTPRPWTRGAERILRPGLRAMWFAARGSLKSLCSLLLAVQIVEAGGRVVILDLENGERRTAERLATILTDRSQAVREACAQRLDYRPRVRLTPLDQPELREAWAQAFAGAELVIIDSLARALAQLGRDESSNADMAQFAVQYLDTIGGRGPAVLLLDNTGWGEPERSRGASNKWDLCELVYRVTADAISVERHGTIRLERVRSRDGDEAEHLHVGAGGGSYGQLQPALPGEHDRQLDRELLAHVHEHPGESVETIAKAVAKRKNRARSRLLALEQDGTVHSSPSQRRDRRGRTTTFTGWYPGPQSQQATVPEHGTDPDRHSSEPQVVPTVRPLKGGTGTADRTNVDDGPRT